MKKIRVAILYGGRSGEHEVSLQSAASVIQNLNRDTYEIIPISIDKLGHWQWNDLQLIKQSKSLPIFSSAPEMRLQPQAGALPSLEPMQQGVASIAAIDVFFPVLHGPLYEDGSIQGLLELADAAYVGSGVLGSAIGMDKDVAKRLAAAAGIPIAPYLCFREPPHDPVALCQEKLSLPLFVKPANMGSSVGVHKVKAWENLSSALADAFKYDTKVLVEQGIDAREIEIAVLENPDSPPLVSLPSEIQASSNHEFYSYEAKYLDESGAKVDLPAKLSPEQTTEAQNLARKIFTSLECSDMARIDLFLDKKTNKFYFNEVNTIPGFTSISMYPKMMEASGIPYQELLHRLIQLAIRRHKRKQGISREFRS